MGNKTEMEKRKDWNDMLGLLKADGLEPSADFLELIESEIKGEVSLKEMRDILEERCKIREQDKKVTLKMIIRFDEEKMNEDGQYSSRDIFDYLNKFASEQHLTVREDGVYTDSGDEENDTYSFMLMGGVLSQQEWMKYASEWIWYEKEDVPQDLLKVYSIHQ